MNDEKEKQHNKDIESHVGAQMGNMASRAVQSGTEAAHHGMDLFRDKGYRLAKVGYEQGKGNLFEFIEGAKLQKNMANAGVKAFDKFSVTDVPTSKGGFGEHTAPDDFRFSKDGKIIGMGQAKVNNSAHRAALNFVNPKYKGMQRNTTIDSVPEIKEALKEMLQKGEISRTVYEDACNNLTGCLTDPDSGITSGGTTRAELKQFCGDDGKVSSQAVNRYARKFELEQYGVETITTAANTGVYSAATTGIVSGTKNLLAVFQNKKELDSALEEIGTDVGKSGVRGFATGALSSFIRIGGSNIKRKLEKKGMESIASNILTNGSAATAIAGGVIDGGVALYEYAKGEITEDQLRTELQNTVVKSTATVYFTMAFGAANTIAPIAIYSAASYIVTATREIIQNAKLNAEEHMRIARLNVEMLLLVQEYHTALVSQLDRYESRQKALMTDFLSAFDYNLATGDNYDAAIFAMVDFAAQTGIALQHKNFDDFSRAMISEEPFVLK